MSDRTVLEWLIEDEDFIKMIGSTLAEEATEFEMQRSLIICGGMIQRISDWGKLESFVSFREMITSQLQGKLRLYDEILGSLRGSFIRISTSGEVCAYWLMPLRIRTRSAGRPATKLLGRGTGERVGRGERGRRPREGNDGHVDELNGQGNDQCLGANGGNLLPAMLAQVSNRGNDGNQNGNVVNENVQENVKNVIMNGNRVGCSYKECLACNPKEYEGKGGVVVLTCWIEKMESVHDMSGCSIDQKVKYTAGSFVGKALMWWNSQILTLSQEVPKLESELWNYAMVEAGHAAYIDRFHELVRLVPHLVTPKSRMIKRYVYGLALQIRRMVAATKQKTIQKVVQISGALTDEAVRNGSIKKVEKRGNVGESSKGWSGRDDNKRTRSVNAFATTMNPVGRENTVFYAKESPIPPPDSITPSAILTPSSVLSPQLTIGFPDILCS
ncbi:hypothetical protein Tco_0347975 [Tanacetum coccineum]